MVTVRIFKRAGRIYRITVEGHANQGNYGQDIVCSAVSAMTLMTLNALTELQHAKMRFDVQEGYVDMEQVKEDPEKQIAIDALFSALELGLYETAKVYKKYLKVLSEEVQNHD